MKKLLFLICVSWMTQSYAQVSENNRFNEKEHVEEGVINKDAEASKVGPGSPGDPVPVDDYLPLLMVLGVIIIAYTVAKQRKSSLKS